MKYEVQSSAAIKTRREEYMEATRAALVAEARKAFAEHGFAGASAEAISRAARVTRGAFYHHFVDKTAIFDAVVVAMETEAATEIASIASRASGLRAKLNAGIDAYLDICVRPDYARIVVNEGPTVLGTRRFHEIEEQHVMALLHANIAALIERGEMTAPGNDSLMLARTIDAVICRIATLLADSHDPLKTRREGGQIIAAIIEGFSV